MQSHWMVGVDAAKDSVMVASADDSFETQPIVNRRAPLKAWLKTLPAGTLIAVEATGKYHLLLADLAYELGLKVYVLNPRAVRCYAKSLQLRGKTDRVDARVIARFLAKEHEDLHSYAPLTAEQRELAQLVSRRAVVVSTRAALKASTADMPCAKAATASAIASLTKLITALDAHREQLMRACPRRLATYRRFQTIVGVGPIVSAGLTQALTRIPFRNADAFVAYTGFDPRPDDSGRKVGRRRLSKQGPSELRRLLFTAGMAASKSKVWKAIYERYRAKGLSTTAAIVILARKIARLAWSMNHYQTDFDISRVPA
jgi:transposase